MACGRLETLVISRTLSLYVCLCKRIPFLATIAHFTICYTIARSLVSFSLLFDLFPGIWLAAGFLLVHLIVVSFRVDVYNFCFFVLVFSVFVALFCYIESQQFD